MILNHTSELLLLGNPKSKKEPIWRLPAGYLFCSCRRGNPWGNPELPRIIGSGLPRILNIIGGITMTSKLGNPSNLY
jgi:hypothetical protein